MEEDVLSNLWVFGLETTVCKAQRVLKCSLPSSGLEFLVLNLSKNHRMAWA